MDYTGKSVKHSVFGAGEIVSQDSEDRISVRFSSGEVKTFSAPKCFETFLKLADTRIQAQAMEHLSAHLEQEKAEADARRKEVWERTLNRAAERRKESGRNREMKVQSFSTVSAFFDAQKANLETEAAYLRATGGRRYRLMDGQLTGISRGVHLYSFESEVELYLPDNIGISLWKGDQAFAATLVNCEEFSLFVAVGSYLGDTVPEIEFSTEPWKLIYDLNDHLVAVRVRPSEIVKALILEGRRKVDFSGAVRKGQELAIRLSRTEPILFVWGPPGTGKTETLAHMVLEHVASGERVLMLSHSNVSVDEAALRVLAKDRRQVPGKLIRYGYPRSKEVLEHEFLSSYNLCLLEHPDLKEQREELIEQRKRYPRRSPEYLHAGKELERIRDLLKKEEKLAVQNARFVATTVSKAIADSTLYEDFFDTVIFDEASMATIPQIVFSASLAKRHFVCIGDFAQLPPIVQSDKAGDLNADIFQYCGIVDAVESGYGHEWLCMLNVQHRMHPAIASFVSKRMYHGLLESAPGMERKRAEIIDAAPAAGDCLALADLRGMMSVCTKTKDQSRFNVLSAMLSLGLAARGAGDHDVGVVTPYNAQSRLLHAMARDLADRDAVNHKITCATVHQFQGSEQDMIVYDAVDCYRMPYPGMLLSSEQNNYANRLFNVAVTRARGKLISLVNTEYMENKKLSVTLMFRQMMDMLSVDAKRGTQILKEMDHSVLQAAADHSLDARFLEELGRAECEVRIDIPGRMDAEPAFIGKLVTALQKLNRAGTTVIIRAENKQELPAEIRPMAIENEYVANPVVLIDKKITWFGQPASGACFIAEGRPMRVWCRPVLRFEGKHCARTLYSLLEMSSIIDMDDRKNEQGTYDTFGAYVRGEMKCEECGKPLMMNKGKSGKYYLVCTDPKCRTFVRVNPEIVDEYLRFGNNAGRFCPEDGTPLTAGQGKKNVYVSCNCGRSRHFWRLDEI
ncbi:MAG: AAA family ATPase [Clostridia bacterium]|nr:AAA family ATPase [Clostridia bacterium]